MPLLNYLSVHNEKVLIIVVCFLNSNKLKILKYMIRFSNKVNPRIEADLSCLSVYVLIEDRISFVIGVVVVTWISS